MKHSSTRPSRRTILLAAVWAMLILLDFAGLFWNISRLSEGVIGTAKFYKTLLHFGISLFSISAVYLAQWLLCFRLEFSPLLPLDPSDLYRSLGE